MLSFALLVMLASAKFWPFYCTLEYSKWITIFLTALECTKFVFGWGSTPDPTVVAYSAPPDPLAGLRGRTLLPRKKREGRRGDGNANSWFRPCTCQASWVSYSGLASDFQFKHWQGLLSNFMADLPAPLPGGSTSTPASWREHWKSVTATITAGHQTSHSRFYW